jgi:hypothetical protein
MGDWVGPVGGSGSYKQGTDEDCKMPLRLSPTVQQTREAVYVVSITRIEQGDWKAILPYHPASREKPLRLSGILAKAYFVQHTLASGSGQLITVGNKYGGDWTSIWYSLVVIGGEDEGFMRRRYCVT